MTDLLAFIFLTASGVFTFPVEQLPYTKANAARVQIGTVLFLCAGFFLERVFT